MDHRQEMADCGARRMPAGDLGPSDASRDEACVCCGSGFVS